MAISMWTLICDIEVTGDTADRLSNLMFAWPSRLDLIAESTESESLFENGRVSGSSETGWVRFRLDSEAPTINFTRAVARCLGAIRSVLHEDEIGTPGWPDERDAPDGGFPVKACVKDIQVEFQTDHHGDRVEAIA